MNPQVQRTMFNAVAEGASAPSGLCGSQPRVVEWRIIQYFSLTTSLAASNAFREPLVAAGYAIEIATDGVSGIEAFHRLNPDMVLVEAMIPKKHGFEVCQELKRTPMAVRHRCSLRPGCTRDESIGRRRSISTVATSTSRKPIAPEQLLKIVGKFFGSAASAPAPKAAEPALAPPDDEADPSDRGPRGAVPLSVSSTETSAQRLQRAKARG